MTYTFNCTLIHISSAISIDHITIRLSNGVPIASYNLGYRTHQITFRKPVQVNNGNYHKLRFNRFGQNSTLQLDSNRTVNLHPKSKSSNGRQFTVFNAHSHIRLGGIDNQHPVLNYDTDYSNYEAKTDDDDEYNQRDDSSEQSDEQNNVEDNTLFRQAAATRSNAKRTNKLIRNKLSYVSNQIVNSLINYKTQHHLNDHFIGVMLNVFVNGYSILDMAAEDNYTVIVSGDVQLLLSLPKSSHRSTVHHSTNHHKASTHENKDLIDEKMQGDQVGGWNEH